MIGFDSTKLCRISGWHNNCGLNALTHFLAWQLDTGFIQNQFANQAAYQDVLRAFQDYYQLKDQPSWADIANLFKAYPNPLDREVLFSPVLRKYLEKTLLDKAGLIWSNIGVPAYSDYLNTGNVTDTAIPMYHANKIKFEALKARYDDQKKSIDIGANTTQEETLARVGYMSWEPPLTNPSTQQIRQHVLGQRKDRLLDACLAEARLDWLDMGAIRYSKLVGNLHLDEMVSTSDLTFMCQNLEIGLTVYTPATLKLYEQEPRKYAHTQGALARPHYPHRSKMSLYNAGAHWELVCPISDAQQAQAYITNHNRCYRISEPELPAYLKDDGWSGQFKLFGATPIDDTVIRNRVQQHFVQQPKPIIFTPAAQINQSNALLVNLEKQYHPDILQAIKDNEHMVQILVDAKENDPLCTAFNNHSVAGITLLAATLTMPAFLQQFKPLSSAQKLQVIELFIPSKIKQLKLEGDHEQAKALSNVQRQRLG